MITVVLNGFRRQDFLERQIANVRSQSVAVEKILIWNNGAPISFDNLGEGVVVANSSVNFGVWSRFAFALNAETEYVCMLDDDTFPGARFFEHCLHHMEVKPALYGARGLRFHSPKRYHPYETFGWDGPNESPQVVDIIGHAWFFKREWLCHFWRELPLSSSSKLVGEDMHFSHMLQKYGNLQSIVPSHPIDDLSVWGSNPVTAAELGTRSVAISGQPNAFEKFDVALRQNTKSGFKLCNELGLSASSILVGPSISRWPWLRKLLSKNKHLEACARQLKKAVERLGVHI